MAATILSGGLCASSAFVTADHTLRGGLVAYVTFPLHQRAAPAPAPAVRAASSSRPVAAAGAKPAKGIAMPKPVSAEMQAIVGVPEIPRTKALKLIWEYIKGHNLQDPEDKRIIVCDEKLKAIFAGRDRVGFLEVAGLIGPHFAK